MTLFKKNLEYKAIQVSEKNYTSALHDWREMEYRQRDHMTGMKNLQQFGGFNYWKAAQKEIIKWCSGHQGHVRLL